VQHARGESKLTTADVGPVLAGYIKGMEQLVSYLDTYKAPTG